MSYNTKNYTEQGGDITHFGGKVIFEEGAEVEGLPAPEVEAATEDTFGGVKAAGKNSGYTVQCKIGADGKLYVPTYPTPSGGGRLVCVFTFNEDTETWVCDQTAEAIKAAFANHDVVDAYYHEGDANIFKMSLCFATTAKIEFKSHISNLYANWENNAWVVHLPE